MAGGRKLGGASFVSTNIDEEYRCSWGDMYSAVRAVKLVTFQDLARKKSKRKKRKKKRGKRKTA